VILKMNNFELVAGRNVNKKKVKVSVMEVQLQCRSHCS